MNAPLRNPPLPGDANRFDTASAAQMEQLVMDLRQMYRERNAALEGLQAPDEVRGAERLDRVLVEARDHVHRRARRSAPGAHGPVVTRPLRAPRVCEERL